MTLVFSNKDLTDSKRAYEFADLFSSIDYFKNAQFQRLMRNWNKYMDFEGDETDEIMAQWEETLLGDFLVEATIWKESHSITWGKGLE